MTKRAYDPELAPLIPTLTSTTPWADTKAARAELEAFLSAFGGDGPQGDEVQWEDRMIAGPQGAPEVRVRIYTPSNPSPTGPSEALPGILYIHGGGFCVGNIEGEHANAWEFAKKIGAVVVSVGYRLAPENPFPAGLEDCYAALCWFAEHAASLGVDPNRIAVSGMSAGGGLAAGLALLTRDRGGPSLCFQMLGIPELDDRLDTPSMREFVDTPLWNRPNAEISWRYYLGESPGEVSPYAAPARAEDLRGLPPAYVSTMEFDPLRDEGLRYAMRLLEQGVSVELHQFPGTFHGSSFVSNAAVSKRSTRETIEALRRALHR